MRKSIIQFSALAAASVLTLAACGPADQGSDQAVEAPSIEVEQEVAEEDSDEQVDAPEVEEDEPAEETDAASEGGQGIYQAELMSGGIATIAVPGEGPADIEEFREQAGADPVGYLVVEVDNTDGDSEAMVFEAEIVDSEGATHTYEEVMTGMDGWTGDNYDLIERELELWDEYPYGTLPGAKNTVPLIGPEVPEDIVNVFIEYTQAEKVGDL